MAAPETSPWAGMANPTSGMADTLTLQQLAQETRMTLSECVALLSKLNPSTPTQASAVPPEGSLTVDLQFSLTQARELREEINRLVVHIGRL